ncbi:PefC/AfrB family outer membrane usher protein [Photobacterium leiognathi]|uniref:PefC/AfrB family outer membrane usher protein n=1 Tax=Photobacterium leiognathi TaxID=553611 RepID=UPI002980BEDB|nr:PefC/AfrB family outer membrane usher protein [Photobacterium leiognathi]
MMFGFKCNYSIKCVLMLFSVYTLNAKAESELDLSFINGSHTIIPDLLKGNTINAPGEYIADVFFNGTKYGRKKLIIKNNKDNKICLSTNWLKSLDLPINYKKIRSAFIVNNNCYDFTLVNSGKVSFDSSSQMLKIQLPQVAILNADNIQNWDYGSSGFRFNYSVGASKSNNSENLDGIFDLNANHGQWVLSAKASGNIDNGLTSPDLTLSTAIKAIRGDIILGKTFTNTSAIPDFAFYGLTLRSNSSMLPWSKRGYAPIIDGVLNTNARVTVKQGNYTLYTENLPAGPFSLTDISPISNGDLVVIIDEDNGISRSKTYPVTVLPSLLRIGDFSYNFAAGIKDNSSPNENVFGLASLDYGLDFGTLNSVSILHPHYQSLGFGASLPLGELGAVSANINYARSYYEQSSFQPKGNHTQKGLSASLQYAKDFGENINVHLLTYRYTGEGYSDFSRFNTHDIHQYSDERSRYEARITQRFGSSYLNATGWYQEYRNGRSSDLGINATLSKNFENGISLGLNATYSKSGLNGSDYSTSVNVSVPLDIWQRTQFINSSISYDSNLGSSFNSGMSFRASDNINSSVNLNVNKKQKTASFYTGIGFDAVQTGFSVTQSNNNTSLSLSASGSVAASSDVGFAYSRDQSDTIALAHINGIKNVSFNGSSPTNASGNTIVPLSNYQSNDIVIDTNNIPENVELLDSNFNVVPTNKAIIVRKYNYLTVHRYLLRVLDSKGNPYPMGTQIKNDKGNDVGFVANNGVLVATVYDKSNFLKVDSAGSICKFDISKIKSGNKSITDVYCKLSR